ncbi:HAD family hydrolase [Buchnera aphidicola (Kurisakia onigurumii)]|uniref:HAD family hydrolase n=1 Tax=Buchnera aphidicola TaxID=9 RepID=UPI0031B6E894
MYQVIVCDLDGTLLDTNYHINEYTKKILKKVVMEKNIHLIIATGRNYIDAKKVLNEIGVSGFIISCNGSEIYNKEKNKIFNCYINEKTTYRLCKIAYLEKEITTQIYYNNKWYVQNYFVHNPKLQASFSMKRIGYKPIFFKNKPVNKVFFTSNNKNKLKKLEKQIHQELHSQIESFFSSNYCLEITEKLVTKGTALEFISKKCLYIPLEKFMSFGDGMNDKSMLSISGKSFIMKNADPILKKKLPNIEIIESNKNNGVAVCIKRYFL